MNTDRAKVVASKLKPTGATWLHGGKTEAHDELQGRRRARKGSLAGLRKASRSRKGSILDEFVAATGVTRKTAITLLRNPPPVTPKPRGKPTKRYGPDVSAALEMLWAMDGYICSTRLVAALPLLIELVEAEGAWGFSEGVKPNSKRSAYRPATAS